MKTEKENYIPALSYHWLTPFYDTAIWLAMPEKVFKGALVEQAKIEPNHRVLDLACGSGTLAVLIKNAQPVHHHEEWINVNDSPYAVAK